MSTKNIPADHSEIVVATKPEGLVYHPDVISPQLADTLTQWIDRQTWDTTLKRRVQHYGYKYNYQERSGGTFLGPLPAPLRQLNEHLQEHKITPTRFNQAIVNEYQPKQGIGKHVDHPRLFGDEIVSVSLLAPTTMRFQHKKQPTYEQRLAVGSVVVMRGPARYVWTHAIAAKAHDVVERRKVLRRRRMSVTFRNYVL